MASQRSQTLALWTVLAFPLVFLSFSPCRAIASAYLPLHSALQCVAQSEAAHHLHVFFIRFLGELP
jgi:hypothetical protein